MLKIKQNERVHNMLFNIVEVDYPKTLFIFIKSDPPEVHEPDFTLTAQVQRRLLHNSILMHITLWPARLLELHLYKDHRTPSIYRSCNSIYIQILVLHLQYIKIL